MALKQLQRVARAAGTCPTCGYEAVNVDREWGRACWGCGACVCASCIGGPAAAVRADQADRGKP